MLTILRGLIRTMRPKQWLTKNIFIFAAVVFDSKLFVPGPFFQTPLVKDLRDRFDPSAAVGVPAHITILYPFLPLREITPAVLAELPDLFAQFSAFEFMLAELRCFPDVLFLAPSPVEPFKALTHAIVERYPDYLPYGGAFAEVVPHLTVADMDEPDQLEAIERGFLNRHGAQLPVKAKASEVQLLDNASGRWEVQRVFALVESRNHT